MVAWWKWQLLLVGLVLLGAWAFYELKLWAWNWHWVGFFIIFCCQKLLLVFLHRDFFKRGGLCIFDHIQVWSDSWTDWWLCVQCIFLSLSSLWRFPTTNIHSQTRFSLICIILILGILFSVGFIPLIFLQSEAIFGLNRAGLGVTIMISGPAFYFNLFMVINIFGILLIGGFFLFMVLDWVDFGSGVAAIGLLVGLFSLLTGEFSEGWTHVVFFGDLQGEFGFGGGFGCGYGYGGLLFWVLTDWVNAFALAYLFDLLIFNSNILATLLPFEFNDTPPILRTVHSIQIHADSLSTSS